MMEVAPQTGGHAGASARTYRRLNGRRPTCWEANRHRASATVSGELLQGDVLPALGELSLSTAWRGVAGPVEYSSIRRRTDIG